MAGFTERISVLIDVTSNKAVSGLKDFQKSVADAQGFTGKLKAGVGSLKDTFTAAASSPAALGTAVAAAGAFAVKAADEFSALGVKIGKFADATGLATEEASRYVEVAGDLNIDVGSLTSVFNKLNREIDPAAFEKLNVEIARTRDGNVDVSNTFLNVIDRLNKIKDPAERATVASQLLGKGWTDVAELIGLSADEVRKRLAAVGADKVFTDSERKQADDYRQAMDAVRDQLDKVILTLGQKLAPSISKAATQFAQLADDATPVFEALIKIKEAADYADFLGLAKGPIGLAQSLKELAKTGDMVDVTTLSLEQLNEVVAKTSPEAAAIAIRAWADANVSVTDLKDGADQSARYLGLLARNTRESADSAADLTGKARLARAELKLLQDQIDGRKSFIDLQIALRTNAERLQQLAEDYKAGKITAEQYYQDVASASLDSQGSLADYVSTLDEIPDTVKTQIIAQFDPLNPQKTWQAIQSYFDSHAIQVRTETDRENRRQGGGVSVPVSGGTGGLSGIRVPGQAESVGGFGRGGGITVNVNGIVTNPAETGRQIADALRAYYRSGGEPV